MNDVKLINIDSGTGQMLMDSEGQPLYSWDAVNREFHLTYDVLRRQLTKEVTPSGSATRQLEVIVYGEGMTEGSTSDTDNNLRGKLYQSFDGTGCKTVMNYDFKGNPLLINENLLADYTIIDVDWSSSPTLNTETFATQSTYDALSRTVTVTDPGNNVTQHTYDIGGLLFAVNLTPNSGSPTLYITDIYYNAKGQRETIDYGNGTTTTYTYDSNTFRLTRLLTQMGSNIYQDLNYWYDPVGNITILKDASQRNLYFSNSIILPEVNYTYDALYRLITATGREKTVSATFGQDNYNDNPWMGNPQPGDDNQCQNYTQKYVYDAVGNILSLQHIAGVGSYTRSYNYDSASNKLLNTQVGSNTYSYTYDAFGNTTQMPHLSGGMTWNTQNQFSIANLGGGGNAYYQYSGGERSHKVIANGAITEERIYLGNYEIYRNYVSGVLQLERTTVHVSDGASRIAMLEVRTVGTDPSPASLVRYIYSNNISTATLELDDSAAIISYEEYHPYGTTSYQATSATINATAKRYRYTGKERDEESGFYYMGARYYAPWLTRWIAVDPINNEWYNHIKGQPRRNHERQFVELTASTYEYCYANPVRFTDPTGEQAPPPPAAPPAPAPQTPTTTGGIGGKEDKSVEEVFINANGKVTQDISRPRKDNEQGTNKDGTKWETVKITHREKSESSSGGSGNAMAAIALTLTRQAAEKASAEISIAAPGILGTIAMVIGGILLPENWDATRHRDEVPRSWNIPKPIEKPIAVPIDATVPKPPETRIALSITEQLRAFATSANVNALPFGQWPYGAPSESTPAAYSLAIIAMGTTIPNISFHMNVSANNGGYIFDPVNASSRAQSFTFAEFTTVLTAFKKQTTFYEKSGSTFKKIDNIDQLLKKRGFKL